MNRIASKCYCSVSQNSLLSRVQRLILLTVKHNLIYKFLKSWIFVSVLIPLGLNFWLMPKKKNLKYVVKEMTSWCYKVSIYEHHPLPISRNKPLSCWDFRNQVSWNDSFRVHTTLIYLIQMFIIVNFSSPAQEMSS